MKRHNSNEVLQIVSIAKAQRLHKKELKDMTDEELKTFDGLLNAIANEFHVRSHFDIEENKVVRKECGLDWDNIFHGNVCVKVTNGQFSLLFKPEFSLEQAMGMHEKLNECIAFLQSIKNINPFLIKINF